MKQIQKRTLALVMALFMLLGTLVGGVAATEDSEQASLGASKACAGHMLGTFSGVPACVNGDGELHICKNNFPDEHFRAYVFGLTGAEDGYFSAQECEGILSVDVNNHGIASLQGIEFFTSITYLRCIWNDITALNVDNNVMLKNLNCIGNQIKALDLSRNIDLEILECDSSQLSKLNVRCNRALIELHCSGNKLTELDLSNNTALLELDCQSNSLSKLDISNNSALQTLRCAHNQLEKLDVSHNLALETLFCTDNQITELNVSNNIALSDLGCGLNRLTALDVSNNLFLNYLECNNNQIDCLDLSRHTDLIWVYCFNNELTKLDVSSSLYLNVFNCSNNHITELYINSYDGFFYELQVSPQTATLPIVQSGDVWTADLSLLMSKDSLSRIDSVSEGNFNLNTGIITFIEKPESITLDCYIGKVNETMQVEISLTEEAQTCLATINGAVCTYAPGQEVTLDAAPAYTEGDWGYRFAGWSGDVDVVADAGSSTTTFTMPARDIVLEAEYLLIGDANQDGALTLEDSLYVAQMAVENRPVLPEGDIDGDGWITTMDVTYIDWYLAGSYLPVK